MIQAAHYGSANIGTVIDLWGKYVSYSQHTETRVHIEEKSNSICYHAIRESVVMKEILKGDVPSVHNPEEICTKVVPGEANRKHLIGKVLHDLYEQ